MRRLLYALMILGVGMIAQAQSKDFYLIISGNTHSRIYLQGGKGNKICLPCNRATLLKEFGDNALVLEYGYVGPCSYGDLACDEKFSGVKEKDYRSCLRRMGYSWVCDVDGQCQDRVLKEKDLKIGLIKIDKERISVPDKYNAALSQLRGVDILIWAVDDEVNAKGFQEFLNQHSEVDIVLLPTRSFLGDSARLKNQNGILLLVPYPDGIRVDIVHLGKENGTWSVLDAKEVSVLSFPSDSEISSLIKRNCYADVDCKTGTCRSGKCVEEKKGVGLKLLVVRPKRCVSCNEKDIYDWLRGFLPSLKMEIVYSDSEEAKKIFDKVNTDMLPVYIIQGALESVDGFENIEDMLVKSEIGYVIRPQVVGMSVFRNRRRIPKRVDIFISGRLSAPVYQELVQIRKIKREPSMKDWKIYFHYLISYENGIWKSLKGPQDMSEILRQICFRKYAPDKYLDYLLCRYELGYPQDNSCEVRLGVDSEKIGQCIANPGEVNYLFISSSKLANEVGANTPGLVLFENQQIFVPSAEIINPKSFKKWSDGKE